jgi:oxygen-independent coproporphyrinogen-3 oxidase
MRHLYVHVPFCARRCSYCDFAIAVRRSVPSERFVDAVLREYGCRRAAEHWDDAPFETVYLGGGTPSRLSPDAVARLLAAFPRADGAEVTLEANPDDVTPDAARAWTACGVNRVSLGVQSFDDEVLRWMHRTHDGATALRAVPTLRDAGVGSLSLDLIFGLPSALGRDIGRDLERALELAPDHLSVYGLTLEPRTPYGRWAARGTTLPAPEERYASEFLRAHETLGAAGFAHYEISNYARVDRAGGSARSRHNSAYWTGAAYAGLGPSAHGLDGRRRRWNLRDWAAYERVVARGEDPVGGIEDLSPGERWLERVYLALRTSGGLPLQEGRALVQDRLVAAVSQGWLTADGEAVRCSPRGWLVLDALVPALTTSAEGG